MKNFTKNLVPGLALAALLGMAAGAGAQSLNLTSGNAGFVTIGRGGTFTLTVTLDAPTTDTLGLSYFLEAPAAGEFTLTARDITGSAFSDLITDDATALAPANAPLAPRNGSDLGGLVADLAVPNPAGSSFVANLTLQADAALAEGDYLLVASSNSIATDAQFNDVALSSSVFRVTVVPEPGVVCALFAGTLTMGALFLRRRR